MSLQIITDVSPNEQGTAIVTIAPTDEDGNAVIFSQLTNPAWQLMRADTETIVNSRTFAASSMSSLQVVLTGDDLAIFGASDSGNRIFSFQATYDSDAGSGLKMTGECKFNVAKLVGQTDVTG